jgi:hypothetical protein
MAPRLILETVDWLTPHSFAISRPCTSVVSRRLDPLQQTLQQTACETMGIGAPRHAEEGRGDDQS